jgi:hypothetical protein
MTDAFYRNRMKTFAHENVLAGIQTPITSHAALISFRGESSSSSTAVRLPISWAVAPAQSVPIKPGKAAACEFGPLAGFIAENQVDLQEYKFL